MNLRHRTLPRRQQGIALALVLVLLVATTMIGTTALRTARIQEQLAGATYDRAVARAAGDAAMIDAHLFVYRPEFEAINLPWAPVFTDKDGWTIDSWRLRDFDWLGGGVQQFGDGRVDGTALMRVKANPTYAVERVPLQVTQRGRQETVVRVTVRATGARVTSEHYSMAFILMPN